MIEPMQYGRCNYAAAIMNGKIYVAGGDIDPFEYSPCLRLSSVECYDPVDNKWTNVANMNFPRTNFALVESNGMLLAIGHHASVERYDPIRDVWTVVSKDPLLCSSLVSIIDLLYHLLQFSDWLFRRQRKYYYSCQFAQ